MTATAVDPGRALRWGSLALFLGAPILIAALTAYNLVSASELESRAARQEALLAQMERRLALGATGAAGGDTSSIYLAAASGTLAKAELQRLVVDMVDRVSGRLIEVQAGEEAPSEDERKVQLRMTLDTTNDKLFELLYAIETGVPLLAIDQIGMRKLPTRAGGEDGDPVLRVTIVLRGHWKGTGE